MMMYPFSEWPVPGRMPCCGWDRYRFRQRIGRSSRFRTEPDIAGFRRFPAAWPEPCRRRCCGQGERGLPSESGGRRWNRGVSAHGSPAAQTPRTERRPGEMCRRIFGHWMTPAYTRAIAAGLGIRRGGSGVVEKVGDVRCLRPALGMLADGHASAFVEISLSDAAKTQALSDVGADTGCRLAPHGRRH